MNLYEYVRSSPVARLDPAGLWLLEHSHAHASGSKYIAVMEAGDTLSHLAKIVLGEFAHYGREWYESEFGYKGDFTKMSVGTRIDLTRRLARMDEVLSNYRSDGKQLLIAMRMIAKHCCALEGTDQKAATELELSKRAWTNASLALISGALSLAASSEAAHKNFFPIVSNTLKVGGVALTVVGIGLEAQVLYEAYRDGDTHQVTISASTIGLAGVTIATTFVATGANPVAAFAVAAAEGAKLVINKYYENKIKNIIRERNIHLCRGYMDIAKKSRRKLAEREVQVKWIYERLSGFSSIVHLKGDGSRVPGGFGFELSAIASE